MDFFDDDSNIEFDEIDENIYSELAKSSDDEDSSDFFKDYNSKINISNK